MNVQTKLKNLETMLEDDLFIIGIIQPQDDGLLAFEDFDRTFRLIQKHALLRLDILLEEDTDKRLNLLRNYGSFGGGFNEDYREMVIDSLNKEEKVYQDLTLQVCHQLEIDLQCFMESQSELL